MARLSSPVELGLANGIGVKVRAAVSSDDVERQLEGRLLVTALYILAGEVKDLIALFIQGGTYETYLAL